ncbi:MAG: hypothetical protein Greene07147_877 [Parcubacteria group bacterium Greene0714_7]|nr:MAG: hypothetical protein Greene07147_877 [Parcubacteria group bacterium Greene0714_7]
MDLYHALNRGVEKKDIFLDTQDYARFVHDLYVFNDIRPAENTRRNLQPQMFDLRSRTFEKREKLVELHGWCLMRNHYHLLLSEKSEGGIAKFLRKLNIGYAKYFNEKYERNGYVFSGRTKKVLIENDAQFNYILHYIHLNPLDYLKGAEEWRIRSKGGIKNLKDALAYLKSYRWSSYLDYIGEQNFPSILTTSLFGEPSGSYEKTIEKYLKGAEHTELKSNSIALE